jgi:hypothetical protein
MRPPVFIPKLALCGLLVGCESVGTLLADRDGDGSPYDGDCDDLDSRLHPDVEEICGDGVINGCLSEPEARAFCRLQGVRSLAEADVTIVGEAAGDAAGWGLASPGDLDGDGLADLVIGAIFEDSEDLDAGAIYVLLSAGAPLSSRGRTLSLTDADKKLTGSNPSDFAGSTVAGVGDISGDGLPDLIVGVMRDDEGGGESGAIYLIQSQDLNGQSSQSGTLQSAAALKLTGESPGDLAGGTTTMVPDLDGDGQRDVLVGAHMADTGALDAGAAYLLATSGALSERGVDSLQTADLVVLGTFEGGQLGLGLAGLEDLDGDGLGELVVGARFHSVGAVHDGAAFIFNSRAFHTGAGVKVKDTAATMTLVGESSKDYSGSVIASAGDVDGDGSSDLLIGAAGVDAGAGDEGGAYLVTSSAALRAASPSVRLGQVGRSFLGRDQGDSAGTSVAAAGDLDGDGLADFTISAWGDDGGGVEAGAVYLLYGGDLTTYNQQVAYLDSVSSLVVLGESGGDQVGAAHPAVDLADDGIADLLMTSQTYGGGAGATYILLGRGY